MRGMLYGLSPLVSLAVLAAAPAPVELRALLLLAAGAGLAVLLALLSWAAYSSSAERRPDRRPPLAS
jgi:hypothetical protein